VWRRLRGASAIFFRAVGYVAVVGCAMCAHHGAYAALRDSEQEVCKKGRNEEVEEEVGGSTRPQWMVGTYHAWLFLPMFPHGDARRLCLRGKRYC